MKNVNGIIAARNDSQNVRRMKAGEGSWMMKLMLTLVTRDTIPHGLRTGYVSGPVSQYFSQVPLENWIKYVSFSVAEVFWFRYLMETTAAGRMAFFNVPYLERNCSRTLRLRFLRLKFVH
jgi:hypothetical protein